jgi:polar amino acid transport system substrate-binding protein
MRAWIVAALVALSLVAVGCQSSTSPTPVTVEPVNVWPAGAEQVTTVPAAAGNADCDAEASLRPSPLPPPGAMPPGSTMARIAERGRLIVGVDQDTNLFGFRNPASGQLDGFDIDLAREMARAIFGDPDRVQLQVVTANERQSMLESGRVDMVIRTYSITCERKEHVEFSTVYYYANQKILSIKGSGIDSAPALSGKRVCAVAGTTSLARLSALEPKPILYGATTWTDCLVMLQQGQVDAISTDDAVLEGLARQDPNVEVVGPSLGIEPYGIGIKLQNTDLVRFVNAVLEEMRQDGTWQRLYDKHLQSLGPSPGPPAPRYED